MVVVVVVDLGLELGVRQIRRQGGRLVCGIDHAL